MEDPGDPLEDLYDPDTLAALDAHRVGPYDGFDDDLEDPQPMLPSRLVRWGRTAALGMVFTGIGLGLQEVLEPHQEHQIVIEVDDTGTPGHLPIELFLDPDSPAGSLCIVRRSPLPTPQV